MNTRDFRVMIGDHWFQLTDDKSNESKSESKTSEKSFDKVVFLKWIEQVVELKILPQTCDPIQGHFVEAWHIRNALLIINNHMFNQKSWLIPFKDVLQTNNIILDILKYSFFAMFLIYINLRFSAMEENKKRLDFFTPI